MLKLKAHSIKTDNANLANKIEIRKIATKDLGSLRVLDCFAGNNKIWQQFCCEKYYGIEKEKGKGKNLYADNKKVIPSLDLSQFNVIDLDSYGIPVSQVQQIFKNPTLQKGTCVLYTCIGNKMSSLNNEILEHFNLKEIYKKSKVMLNGKSKELFYAYLYDLGIRKTIEHQEESRSFSKVYGFFYV